MTLTTDQQNILITKQIAERMRNPEIVKSMTLHPQNLNPNPLFKIPQWSDLSFAGGYPGILLLFSELDRLFPDEKWDSIVHAYVLKIKEAIESQGISQLSLYGGLSGICFSLHQASRNGTRYQKLIDTLNQHLLKEVRKNYLISLEANLKQGASSSAFLYDLIQGIVGICVYAITQKHLPSFVSLIEELLHFLICLTHTIEIEGKQVPGWYLSSDLQFLEDEKKRYPKGNFNLGLAHGVPGILSILSVAMLHGISVEGQRDAIENVAHWLETHRSGSQENYFWEARISFEEEISERKKEHAPHGRDAWCYGTPGVASSLILAAKALNNDSLKEFALDSFRSVFRRTRDAWNLPGPTFCHGISGLLLITHQIFKQTRAADLQKHIHSLTDILLQYYHSDHCFGFKDFEVSQKGGYYLVDRPGFLEGTSGILLTLLSIEGLDSWWHAPLLINDG